MSGRAGCPLCGGTGFVVDRDPLKPARVCDCTRDKAVDGADLGLPTRYREATFAAFWKWWRDHEPRRQVQVIERLGDLETLLAAPGEQTGPLPQRDRLERLVHHARTSVNAAVRPLGSEELAHWATKGKARGKGDWELWYLHGPPQSGKSTLAAAALKAWCERTQRPGRFVSVRTLGQQVKNAYFEVRSFQNVEFTSVRELMAPLRDQPCLVLDEWDCVDGDTRVAAAFADLLTHRYHENLPTLLTANLDPEALDRKEGWPFTRMQDASFLKRLERAERVEMIPALAWWLDRL